jgi:hypothetical protein
MEEKRLANTEIHKEWKLTPYTCQKEKKRKEMMCKKKKRKEM